MTLAAFPWQNAIATVMALVGGYLAFWPTKKPIKRSRSSEFYGLYVLADHWVEKVRDDRSMDWYEREKFGTENLIDLARDGISLALTFQKAGINAPNFQNPSAEKVCVGLEHYFSAMIPFMRDGHVAQVEGMAVAQAKCALEVGETFDPRRWRVGQA